MEGISTFPKVMAAARMMKDGWPLSLVTVNGKNVFLLLLLCTVTGWITQIGIITVRFANKPLYSLVECCKITAAGWSKTSPRSFSLRKKPTFLIKNLTWKKWTGIATFLYYRTQNYKTNSTIYITKNDTHYFLIAQEMLESQICLWCIFVNNLPDKVSWLL